MLAYAGGVQLSMQAEAPMQSGSWQSMSPFALSSWPLRQSSLGSQPVATIEQYVLQMSCPEPRPSTSQERSPKSVPSHCSPGSFIPLPQSMGPPVLLEEAAVLEDELLEELDAPPPVLLVVV